MPDQMRLPGTTNPRRKGRNYRAANKTIKLRREAGGLEPVDEAKVAIIRTLADNIDQLDAAGGSEFTIATLAGRYLQALETIYERDDTHGPDLADLFAEVGYDTGEPPF
jgi:hypothetical protein